MKTKIILFAVVAIAAIIGFAYWQHKQIVTLKVDNIRLSNNQTALMKGVKIFKTQNGNYAALVDVLTLKVSELTDRNTSLEQTARELRIKLKRVQSYSQTATSTTIGVTTPVKDSAIIHQGKRDTFKCIDYRDNWVRLQGCYLVNNFAGTIAIKDTIRQVVHRVPKQWWFIKWGTKAIRQEVVSSNPYTKIAFTEYIEVK